MEQQADSGSITVHKSSHSRTDSQLPWPDPGRVADLNNDEPKIPEARGRASSHKNSVANALASLGRNSHDDGDDSSSNKDSASGIEIKDRESSGPNSNLASVEMNNNKNDGGNINNASTTSNNSTTAASSSSTNGNSTNSAAGGAGTGTNAVAASNQEDEEQKRKRSLGKIAEKEGELRRKLDNRNPMLSFFLGDWSQSYFTVIPHRGVVFAPSKKAFLENKNVSIIPFSDIASVAISSNDETIASTKSNTPTTRKTFWNNSKKKKDDSEVATTFEIKIKKHAKKKWANKTLCFEAKGREEALAWVYHLQDKLEIKARIYKLGPSHEFPESYLSRSPVATRTAICFNGGGGRAHVACSGQLRALHHLGVLNSNVINYMSGVSAGSWATGIYCFYKDGAKDDTELLGEVTTDFSTVTLAKLHGPAAPLPSVLGKGDSYSLAKELIWTTNPHRLWQEIIGRQYLQPFGLSENVPFCRPEDYETIIAKNPQLKALKFHISRPGRPFWVAHGTIIGPEWARVGDVVPIQFTPLYSGTPFEFEVKYRGRRGSDGGREEQMSIGGAMLDSFAFGGNAPDDLDEMNKSIADHMADAMSHTMIAQALQATKEKFKQIGADQGIMSSIAPGKDNETPKERRKRLAETHVKDITVPHPQIFFSLKDALGISSDAPSYSLHDKAFYNKINSQGMMYNPNDLSKKGEVFDMGDGGSLDNTGLLGMLQRGVKRCMVFVNTNLRIPVPAQVDLSARKSKRTKNRVQRRRSSVGRLSLTAKETPTRFQEERPASGSLTKDATSNREAGSNGGLPPASVTPPLQGSVDNTPMKSKEEDAGGEDEIIQQVSERDIIVERMHQHRMVNTPKKEGILRRVSTQLMGSTAELDNSAEVSSSAKKKPKTPKGKSPSKRADVSISENASTPAKLLNASVTAAVSADATLEIMGTPSNGANSNKAEDEDHENLTAQTDIDINTPLAFEEWPTADILPLFGIEVTDESLKELGRYDNNTVFPAERSRGLLAKFQEKWMKGEPIIVTEKYPVLENKFWGIKGGWEVEIMWFYLEDSYMFRSLLPVEVQDEINKGADGEFYRFPNFKTFGAKKDRYIDPALSIPQINILALYCEWALLKNKDEVLKFLSGN